MISFIRIFAPLLYYHILWSCFRYLFLFIFVCGFAAVFFSFVFISGQNFSFSSKDAAVTTAAVELNIRTIIVLLLLTLKTICYSRELSVL